MANGRTRMFVKQLLTNPVATGAIAPSSGSLARKMVAFAAPPAQAVIAEFGPGTGAFTREIIASLLPEQKFFAIEVNPDFISSLKEQFPALAVHPGCASTLPDVCREEGVEHVDCVISGLPWANFPVSLQEKIIGNMLSVMPAGGVFLTFAYLQGLVMPGGRNFKRLLKRSFSRVENSGVVWMNLPPAIIYRCVK